MGELEWRGLEVITTKTNQIEKEQYVNSIKQPNTSSKYCKKTLPETNEYPLKIDGWKMNFPLVWPIFGGYVSFRECRFCLFEK